MEIFVFQTTILVNFQRVSSAKNPRIIPNHWRFLTRQEHEKIKFSASCLTVSIMRIAETYQTIPLRSRAPLPLGCGYETRLRALAALRCAEWGGELLEMNGESDHAHFLLRLPPSVAPASFVNNLKTTSSRLLRKEFAEHVHKFYWKPVFWSWSYCMISCGGAPLSVVKQYIENQGRA